MAQAPVKTPDSALAHLHDLLPDLEALYKDIHAHPELSMRETRTANIAAERLRAAGFDVTTGVGKTGVVGLLRNGDGPVVMLRADMDALPVKEATGLPYAKTVPVAHACGHDMHVPAWRAPPLFSHRTAPPGMARCWLSSSPRRRSGKAPRRCLTMASSNASPNRLSYLASTSWSGPLAKLAYARGSSPPLPTVSRFRCSGVAPTARCRKPVLIRS